MKVYKVHKIEPGLLNINGRINNIIWEQASSLNDFSSPWKAMTVQKTEFKALWDEDYLYFGFTVFEKDVYTDFEKQGNEAINNSDRVELFFRKDAGMNPYFCLEMDTHCRIMDFKALPGKKFDFEWQWPNDGLEILSFRDHEKFQVEGKISIQALDQLKLRNQNKIEAGIYRANYLENDAGQRDAQWICWVDPKTDEPNFHIPSSFGTFVLEEESKSKQ